MNLSYQKLDSPELASALASAKEWTLEDGMLTRLFKFGTYQEGLDFAMAVGRAADVLNHHPDILIGFQKVRVSTVTHDSGGLTAYDFELARRVDAIAAGL